MPKVMVKVVATAAEVARKMPSNVTPSVHLTSLFVFFFQAEDGIRDIGVTGVQTCALPIYAPMNANIATTTIDGSGTALSNSARCATVIPGVFSMICERSPVEPPYCTMPSTKDRKSVV